MVSLKKDATGSSRTKRFKLKIEATNPISLFTRELDIKQTLEVCKDLNLPIRASDIARLSIYSSFHRIEKEDGDGYEYFRTTLKRNIPRRSR